MKILCEHIVNTDKFAGTVDLITGLDDFKEQVEYVPEWHTYKLNGEIIPSVTQLLDDGEYLEVDEQILKYAQDKGTLIHKEIQEWLESHKLGFTSEFYEFEELFTKNRELFEELAIFDFKTYSSNTLAKQQKCYRQMRMYAEAIEYLTGVKIENLYEVWLPHNKPGRIINLREKFKDEF